MFYGQDPFYFATIRKLNVAFGTLFNNIKVQRFSEAGGQGSVIRTITVPLSYASGERWYVHKIEDTPAQGGVQTRISLPRIGFAMIGMQYDSNRKQNTLNHSTTVKNSDVTQFLKNLNPVPYDFQFETYVAAKTMDDGLQIIEQILPHFQPSFNLTINDLPELNIVRDVPIIFNNISFNDQYEGSFDDQRVLEWTLSFTAKGYLYPAIKDAEVIRKVIANIYKDEEMEQKSGIITVEVDPVDAAFTDDWSEETIVFGEEHIDADGNPVVDSNGNPVEVELDGSLMDVISSACCDLDATMLTSTQTAGQWKNLIVSPASGDTQASFNLATSELIGGYGPQLISEGNPDAYWLMRDQSEDGAGDSYFTSLAGGSSLPSIWKNMHKETSQDLWFAVCLNLDTRNTPAAWFSTRNASGQTGVLMNLEYNPDEHDIRLQGYNDAGVSVGATPIDTGTLYSETDLCLIFSISKTATTLEAKVWSNSRTAEDITGTWGSAAFSSSDPDYFRLFYDAFAGQAIPYSSKIYAFSCGNEYLTDAKAERIIDFYNARHNRTYVE